MPLHFLVLGGTGAIGTLFTHKALVEGHRLTLYARNPSKLSDSLRAQEKLDVIEGELSDMVALETAAKCGADAFISCAGPLSGSQGTPITDCYAKLLPLLASNGVHRAIMLCTPSFSQPEDSFSLLWSFGRVFMRLLHFTEFNEMVSVGELVTLRSPADMTWTLFRVGGLTDGAEKNTTATMLGSGKDHVTISRESVAAWLLKEIKDSQWKLKAPYICNT
ncbi:hypothetical protein WALSEDRAFT_68096 [Wallemia mellicola CBS 633.66]|uniref:NAD(P)-binding domain-containing protein n=1 Tax=Wallemia mellicola (strain ATCC MYA-4683 / CBS 633.66) TaxID=671144 RepID=I4YFB1_WALMC|nr:hypothetical protein WALSEDRAFT_68096 [Wallemia mellicola CBS 633.66]EIM22653.1 hypothetical protein WALSEDRAFT_68096 [Wallemia mellicola CBS 633.66]|eukprot:XP_006957318.1 hypothetical protein WALSEDRAFT_68096 [Wallemia mellicola CBS 633.66]